MGILKRREKEMSDKINDALISNLKGRISKVLVTSAKLPLEERSGLEGIYDAIDTWILSKKEDVDLLNFNEEVSLHFKFIKDTKKEYIKEHIIPIINKVSTKRWKR